ncbi:hypothetical protein N7532_003724 [Penicillium argentinense]|uniref:Uncharacterized protein n=1 Tax=Penicillium argentinense TaxID=1131581 RepID=A0A9W9FN01_9EURO|nr:uncharacterized protein N7532_003724 [Penicillium argentinense]KAJ5103195.1 hypothetical protein N7532_003724 [Penicillium argentinense]
MRHLYQLLVRDVPVIWADEYNWCIRGLVGGSVQGGEVWLIVVKEVVWRPLFDAHGLAPFLVSGRVGLLASVMVFSVAHGTISFDLEKIFPRQTSSLIIG